MSVVERQVKEMRRWLGDNEAESDCELNRNKKILRCLNKNAKEFLSQKMFSLLVFAMVVKLY